MSETPPELPAIDTSTASLLLMIGRLQGHIAATRHALHHRIDRFREGLNDQGDKIEELQLDVSGLEAKLNDQGDQIEELLLDVKELEAKLEDYEGRALDEQHQTNRALNERCNRLEAMVKRLDKPPVKKRASKPKR